MTSKIQFTLPYPPSINKLFATSWKSKQRFRSKVYKAWAEEAGYALKGQIKPDQRFGGFIAITMRFGRPDKRKRDLDNLAKPVCDLLVSYSVIKDDSYITSLHLLWDETIQGASITIDESPAFWAAGASPTQYAKPAYSKGARG